MRNLAVFGAMNGSRRAPFRVVSIDDMRASTGIVRTPEPAFDPHAPGYSNKVLVRVHTFSCNYRDKSFILAVQDLSPERFLVLGSEFAGTVVDVGDHVDTISEGDRVIADHHWSGRGLHADGTLEGIATNHASREYLVLPARKLIRIPESMTAVAASAFSLGAQTAYSMIRRIAPQVGAKVLVTSATSNTSLYVIAALRQLGVVTYASTSSSQAVDQLHVAGADEVLVVGRHDAVERFAALDAAARSVGGFDCIFDPFFDLHLMKAAEVLAPFGRYATCGFVAQNPGAARRAAVTPIDTGRLLTHMMMKNLTVVGNCIGLTEDLYRALNDYRAGRLDPVVDSVITGDDAAGFLDRTYNSRERFGKVVFQYT